MKIHRFKNLWFMGLLISAIILGAVYLLKIFLPQFVIEVAHIDSIVNIGHYIDTHKWAWFLVSFIMSFLAYYFYCCATCGKNKLTNKEILIIISTILILFGIKGLIPNIYTVVNVVTLIVLPYIFKSNFKNTVVCFSFTNILQVLTLEIRGIGTMIIDFNYATLLILMIDYYILSVLLYFYFNYKEE
jgi:hypothetical protein